MSTPAKERPLSPHLQVYRLPMTALMSISHRITGFLLTAGTTIVAAWLIAAALGEGEYEYMMYLAQTTPGTLVLMGWSFALYYHMCNGIRHMFWDMGFLLTEQKARISGYLVICIAIAMTIITWGAFAAPEVIVR